MSSHNGRHGAALRGLAVAVAVAAVAAGSALGWSQLSALTARRRVADSPRSYQCETADKCAVGQLQAGVRAANANEDAVDVAIWQLALSIVGMGGVLLTIYYAHKAWVEAERSADVAVASARPWLDVEITSRGPMGIARGVLYIPLQMEAVNEGTTPAQAVTYGRDGYAHAVDDWDIERFLPRALQSALSQKAADVSFAVFPGKRMTQEIDLLFDVGTMSVDSDGQFTVTFGLVLRYAWSGDKEGLTKVTGMLTPSDENPSFPDGWRFNLPALEGGLEIPFNVERHRFRDRYT